MTSSPDDSDKMARNDLIKEALRSVRETTNGDIKALMKEALKEWLDEKYAAAGRWGLSWLLAAAIAALAFFTLWKAGWTPPK